MIKNRQNMKISKLQLEYPWTKYYTKGGVYLNNKTKRKYVKLWGNGKECGTSYARYLYTVHLGEMIPDHLEVDHINNNPFDDRIDNFQLLSPKENKDKFIEFNSKTIIKRRKIYIERLSKKMQKKLTYDVKTARVLIECTVCKKKHLVNYGSFRRRVNVEKRTDFYCSTECYAKPSDEVIEQITELVRQGVPGAIIAKRLKVGYDTVLKYSKIPVPNYTHASKNTLPIDIINKINEYHEKVTNSDIAKILGITINSVMKYRKIKPIYTRGITDMFRKQNHIKQEIIDQIKYLENQGYSERKIARILNISRYTVEKHRQKPILGSKELSIISEMLFYRKKAIKLATIQELVGIGGARVSKYASYSQLSEVQEKLKDYSINQYSYYSILKNQTGQLQSSETNDQGALALDLSLCEKYINYHNYQINALKSFHEPNGDFTIYSTIELDDDVSFVTICGTL